MKYDNDNDMIMIFEIMMKYFEIAQDVFQCFYVVLYLWYDKYTLY